MEEREKGSSKMGVAVEVEEMEGRGMNRTMTFIQVSVPSLPYVLGMTYKSRRVVIPNCLCVPKC